MASVAARARLVSAIISEAEALSDTVSSEHTTDAQKLAWASQGLAELWQMLVAADPNRYTTTATISTTAGTSLYSLPAACYQVRRLDMIVGTARYPVERFELQEPPYDNTYPSQGTQGGVPRYCLLGQDFDGEENGILFDPDPGTNTFTLYYVRTCPVVTSSSDSFDGVIGWEGWVVCYIASRLMIREETDPSPVLAEMARIEQRIKTSSAKRNSSRATRIADVKRRTPARGRWY